MGKRGFKAYSSPEQAGWNKPGGGGEPGDPYELSMHSVRLKDRLEPFGMDGGRKRGQRRMLWYWRHSRDWWDIRLTRSCAIEPDKIYWELQQPHEPQEQEKKTVWFWRWPNVKKLRDRQGAIVSGHYISKLALSKLARRALAFPPVHQPKGHA